MIELLCGHLIMTRLAEVARVAVDIVTAQCERLDMIDLGSEANDIAIEAAFA